MVTTLQILNVNFVNLEDSPQTTHRWETASLAAPGSSRPLGQPAAPIAQRAKLMLMMMLQLRRPLAQETLPQTPALRRLLEAVSPAKQAGKSLQMGHVHVASLASTMMIAT